MIVPSTGEAITYRPYVVKEEKILLIAMEAQEQSGILNAVKDIVKSCTFDKFDVSLFCSNPQMMDFYEQTYLNYLIFIPLFVIMLKILLTFMI